MGIGENQMSKTQDERLFDAAKVAIQGLITSYLPYHEDETVLARRFWNYITANIDDITEAILDDDVDAYEVHLDEEQEDYDIENDPDAYEPYLDED